MGLLKSQREALIGMVLGDAYLQPTGKRNARLRLEHSVKQKDYIFYKYELLKNMMQRKPKFIKRFNPHWKKHYSYYRLQSHSSPIFGKFRRWFYPEGKKRIPINIKGLLKTPLSLAIWYMDDGYYYHRDECIFLYLSDYPAQDIQRLKETLEENYDLLAKYKKRKKSERYLFFNKEETKKFIRIVRPHIIPLFDYKLPLTP